jgi:hypothetical protein
MLGFFRLIYEMLFKFWQFFITYIFFWKITLFLIKILFAVLNVVFVGYSLAKNNLNNTYQHNMISKNFSKTIRAILYLVR